MKIVLLSCIVAGFGYLGYGFSRFYIKRYRFFGDCVLFCERLCVDINFSKDKLYDIVTNTIYTYSKDMQIVLSSYQNFLLNKTSDLEDELTYKTINLLNDDERNTFVLFMKNLGRLDSYNQTKEIENFKGKFETYRNQAEIDNKKFGGLFVKLGVILGLLLAILLM